MNGKGLWAGLCTALFGSYAAQPGVDTFTKPPPSADKPAPNILALKGKRLLLVTETEERFKLQAAWMKTLRDQTSVVQARTLYKEPVSFHPSWLIMMSTNVQLKWSTMDGGVLRSYCAIPWPITFAPIANASKNIRKGNPDLKRPGYARKMAPQFFFILRAINRVFMRDGTKATVVLPRPREVVLCTEEMTNADTTGSLSDFIANHVAYTAEWKDATTDAQIIKAFVTVSKVLSKNEAMALLQKQFTNAIVNGRRLMKCTGTATSYVMLQNMPNM